MKNLTKNRAKNTRELARKKSNQRKKYIPTEFFFLCVI